MTPTLRHTNAQVQMRAASGNKPAFMDLNFAYWSHDPTATPIDTFRAATIGEIYTSGIIDGANKLHDLIAVLINGHLYGTRLTGKYKNDTTWAAQRGSDVERKGVFYFESVNGLPVRVAIPGIHPSKFIGDNINLADTAVANFVDHMTTGFTLAGGGTLRPCDAVGGQVTNLVRARKEFIKSMRRG